MFTIAPSQIMLSMYTATDERIGTGRLGWVLKRPICCTIYQAVIENESSRILYIAYLLLAFICSLKD